MEFKFQLMSFTQDNEVDLHSVGRVRYLYRRRPAENVQILSKT
jgi:hypothetical protein